jgi:beta propeller repeat protein
VVVEPGDQVNPSLDGSLLVYQDNRSGHYDESGVWVGEWDLYMKDLDTGIEVPLCTAAGDQVNPRIDGNTIVWQDNRSGDWDIYAAVLGGEPVGDPELAVRIEDVFWAAYSDYEARKLTVRYQFENRGNGPAYEFALNHVITTPAEVSVMTMPGTVGTLVQDETVVLDVFYHIPQGVTLFRTALYGSCTDSSGTEMWFPEAPPALS